MLLDEEREMISYRIVEKGLPPCERGMCGQTTKNFDGQLFRYELTWLQFSNFVFMTDKSMFHRVPLHSPPPHRPATSANL